MEIVIDNSSSVPVYQQVIDSIEKQIVSRELAAGECLPSMNVLSENLGISKETAKKAYNILRSKGFVESAQGKGFFVRNIEDEKVTRVLVLFDKLSTYKLVLYRSFAEGLGDKVDVTIHLHNQDVKLFGTLLEANLRNDYDYYVVTPHFPTDAASQREVVRLLRKIPNRKLILLDKMVPELAGNYGAVYQDFEQDVYEGLMQGLDHWKRYRKINVVVAPSSLYAQEEIRGIDRFFKQYKLKHGYIDTFRREDLRQGEVYIVVGGQLDRELFDILRTAQENGFKLGEDIGVVSYNDSPINEFIINGLASLSTNFAQMGRIAAEMVNSGNLIKVHNEFRLVVRNSL